MPDKPANKQRDNLAHFLLIANCYDILSNITIRYKQVI